MSDLINKEDAVKAVTEELDLIDHIPQWVFDRLTSALNKVTTINAVVRCKECKYWGKHYEKGCGMADYETDPNHYCAWGERKTE